MEVSRVPKRKSSAVHQHGHARATEPHPASPSTPERRSKAPLQMKEKGMPGLSCDVFTPTSKSYHGTLDSGRRGNPNLLTPTPKISQTPSTPQSDFLTFAMNLSPLQLLPLGSPAPMPFSPMEQGVTPTFSDFCWSPQTPQITSAPTEIFPAASPLPLRHKKSKATGKSLDFQNEMDPLKDCEETLSKQNEANGDADVFPQPSMRLAVDESPRLKRRHVSLVPKHSSKHRSIMDPPLDTNGGDMELLICRMQNSTNGPAEARIVETCRLDSRDKRPHAMQESSFGERCGASNAAEDSHPLGAEEAGAVLLSLSSPSKPVKMQLDDWNRSSETKEADVKSSYSHKSSLSEEASQRSYPETPPVTRTPTSQSKRQPRFCKSEPKPTGAASRAHRREKKPRAAGDFVAQTRDGQVQRTPKRRNVQTDKPNGPLVDVVGVPDYFKAARVLANMHGEGEGRTRSRREARRPKTPEQSTPTLMDASPSEIMSVSPPPFKPSGCNCKKSKCLKLYCECFQQMRLCDGCNCRDCMNTEEFKDIRQAAVDTIRERNPSAFEPKIKNGKDGGKHIVGCHCKKSACLKKYCECYQARVACSSSCRCMDCQNTSAGRFDQEPVANDAVSHQSSTDSVLVARSTRKATPVRNLSRTLAKESTPQHTTSSTSLGSTKRSPNGPVTNLLSVASTIASPSPGDMDAASLLLALQGNFKLPLEGMSPESEAAIVALLTGLTTPAAAGALAQAQLLMQLQTLGNLRSTLGIPSSTLGMSSCPTPTKIATPVKLRRHRIDDSLEKDKTKTVAVFLKTANCVAASNGLPVRAVVRVFSCMSGETLYAVSVTCKKLRDIATGELVWRHGQLMI